MSTELARFIFLNSSPSIGEGGGGGEKEHFTLPFNPLPSREGNFKETLLDKIARLFDVAGQAKGAALVAHHKLVMAF